MTEFVCSACVITPVVVVRVVGSVRRVALPDRAIGVVGCCLSVYIGCLIGHFGVMVVDVTVVCWQGRLVPGLCRDV
jgi:hypothetical protein